MESWNNVINIALLGTEKRSLDEVDVDASLVEFIAAIAEQTTSREDAFLQTAALVYNRRQCGFMPLQNETASIPKAEAESKSYASLFAHTVLKDAIETGSISLLRFWLEQCEAADKIIEPEMIPVLLEAGVKTKSLQGLITACCGKRGAWLQQFNEEWKWYKTGSGEDRWQTGTVTQRTTFLASLRQSDPAKALALLQETWAQESAATKAELLEGLKANAGGDDVPWLEELLNEKSTKVKDAALAILKTIPASDIVKRYWNILQSSVKLVTSKGLLGIGAKTSLEITLVDVDSSIFKTGIEPLSGQANIPDEQFIIYQLIGYVPPHFWELHFNMDGVRIIELFLKSDKYRTYVPAFGSAATRFKDLTWMRNVIALDESSMHLDAFYLLPQKEAETYALKFFAADNDAASVLHNIRAFTNEWSLEFSKAVLRYTAKNPYNFHRGFYNGLAALLPVPLVGELEKCTPKEEHLRTMWSNLSEHITKLLTLKLQTLKAFNE